MLLLGLMRATTPSDGLAEGGLPGCIKQPKKRRVWLRQLPAEPDKNPLLRPLDVVMQTTISQTIIVAGFVLAEPDRSTELNPTP